MVFLRIIQETITDQGSHKVTYPHILRPMVDLECKIEEVIVRKIDNALSRKNDRRRQMVLEEDPSFRKSWQSIYQKASYSR